MKSCNNIQMIIDRHDLWLRSDSELAAVHVLLADSVNLLTEAEEIVFQEQALTPASNQALRTVIQKLQDALQLAALCPLEPVPGTVTILPDGTRRWQPSASD